MKYVSSFHKSAFSPDQNICWDLFACVALRPWIGYFGRTVIFFRDFATVLAINLRLNWTGAYL